MKEEWREGEGLATKFRQPNLELEVGLEREYPSGRGKRPEERERRREGKSERDGRGHTRKPSGSKLPDIVGRWRKRNDHGEPKRGHA